MRLSSPDTLEDVRALSGLLEEYIHFVCADLQRFSGVAYDPASLVDRTLGSLDRVIPPHGRTFVAAPDGGEPFGMVFLRPSGRDGMEIKRLYVRPGARGTGAGRALVSAALEAAREAGAATVRLDTTRNLETAIALYRAMGFEERGPYEESDHFGDEVLGPYLVFMEKRIG